MISHFKPTIAPQTIRFYYQSLCLTVNAPYTRRKYMVVFLRTGEGLVLSPQWPRKKGISTTPSFKTSRAILKAFHCYGVNRRRSMVRSTRQKREAHAHTCTCTFSSFCRSELIFLPSRSRAALLASCSGTAEGSLSSTAVASPRPAEYLSFVCFRRRGGCVGTKRAWGQAGVAAGRQT